MNFNIKYHNRNLISIGYIQNDYCGRTYLRYLIQEFVQSTYALYVNANRRNYILDFAPNLINIFSEKKVSVKVADLDDGISFWWNSKNKLDENLLFDLLIDLWIEYEQIFILFSNEKNDINKRVLSNLSWDIICSEMNSFIMFKSVEDNVIWIGKSSQLNFPFIEGNTSNII